MCGSGKMNDKQKIKTALEFISQYGGIDGAHHKAWLIDQVVRTLTCEQYTKWIKEYCFGDDGDNTYEWDEGIPP